MVTIPETSEHIMTTPKGMAVYADVGPIQPAPAEADDWLRNRRWRLPHTQGSHWPALLESVGRLTDCAPHVALPLARVLEAAGEDPDRDLMRGTAGAYESWYIRGKTQWYLVQSSYDHRDLAPGVVVRTTVSLRTVTEPETAP
jgi:hypothetical protein